MVCLININWLVTHNNNNNINFAENYDRHFESFFFLCFFFVFFFFCELTGIPNTYNCVTKSIITWKTILLGVVADQEAKCKIQNMKGHHGYFGCSYCDMEGDYIGVHPHGHVYFPGPIGVERTRETYIRRSQPGVAENVCLICCYIVLLRFAAVNIMSYCCHSIFLKFNWIDCKRSILSPISLVRLGVFWYYLASCDWRNAPPFCDPKWCFSKGNWNVD